MDIQVYPGKPLSGEISLPGDKSISHRAALFAALAEGESRVENFLLAGVTDVMLYALKDLGIEWENNGDCLSIYGKGISGLQSLMDEIYCGNSGTTLRLLAGALTAANVSAVLTGSDGLCRRPMKRVVDPLRSMGALIEASSSGTAPLKLSSRGFGIALSGEEHVLAIASAQVKTAILLAGLSANEATTVIEPTQSRDHSERMLSAMGVEIEQEDCEGKNCVTLHPLGEQSLYPVNMVVPGDFSSASFLVVAALTTPGSEILIRNVGLNPTRTGLLDVLLQMGADIEIENQSVNFNEPIGDILVRSSKLRGISVSGDTVVRMIDEFPVFAVAGAYASGETVVSDAKELRYKESDRIASVCEQLKHLGVQVMEQRDGFVISGLQKPTGGVVEPHGDHRLAMSMAVCGLGAEKLTKVKNAEIFRESYPNFVADLKKLGATVIYG